MRYDSGIASIYDEAGVEIENAELLFTEEGNSLKYKFMKITQFVELTKILFKQLEMRNSLPIL